LSAEQTHSTIDLNYYRFGECQSVSPTSTKATKAALKAVKIGVQQWINTENKGLYLHFNNAARLI
jgi:hypothetical protein